MKTYGLIGYPVKHSLSAAMHNAAFRHLGIDAEYKLFEVRPEKLGDFFSSFKNDLSGINITIPHKVASVNYVDSTDNVAEMIGAINTVVLEDGKLRGYNTDATGFLESLRKDLKFNPTGKKAVVFGAGGAARAITFALGVIRKVKGLILTDIDTKRATQLASELQQAGCNAIAVDNSPKATGELVRNSDLLVNASPCGMKKNDPKLISPEFLHENLTVFDAIYTPKETALVKDAKKRGCRATGGAGMLLYQGALAFKLWTGKEAPLDVMYKALEIL